MSVSKRRLCLATSKVVKYSPPLWKLLISWKSFKLFVWGRYCCSRMDNKQTTLNIVLYKKMINIDMIRNNELNIETITVISISMYSFNFLASRSPVTLSLRWSNNFPLQEIPFFSSKKWPLFHTCFVNLFRQLIFEQYFNIWHLKQRDSFGGIHCS